MIRAIARRMFVGALLLRAWSVMIVCALLAVATNPIHAHFAWLAVFMAIAFWVLDAHFLRQARLYRKTHERVERLSGSDLDFSLDTKPVDSEADAWGSVLFSRAPGIFHGTVIAFIVVVRTLSP